MLHRWKKDKSLNHAGEFHKPSEKQKKNRHRFCNFEMRHYYSWSCSDYWSHYFFIIFVVITAFQAINFIAFSRCMMHRKKRMYEILPFVTCITMRFRIMVNSVRIFSFVDHHFLVCTTLKKIKVLHLHFEDENNVNNRNLTIHNYKGHLKSSKADQYIFIECDQMRFIFQHSFLSNTLTSSIGIAVLESYW